MKTLKDFNIKNKNHSSFRSSEPCFFTSLRNKRVLVRCDFQVPLSKEGEILDDFRIRQTIPTIEYLISKKSKIILMSHWKPMESGKKAESLKLIFPRIEKLLGRKIKFLDDCIGEKVKKEIKEMKAGEVVILENLRMYREEEENDENFAKQLSQLADIYINDAFGVSHRAHASLVGIPKYLPSGAGFLLEKEIKALNKILQNPEKPLIAIIGGAKVETKTKFIDKISEIAEFILLGGLLNKELKEKNIKLKYPEKIIGAGQGFDVGAEDIKIFKEKIKKAKTIFWTGPLGKIEEEKFSKGTEEIAKAIIGSKAFSVVGGGETIEFLNKTGLISKFNHVSTGGGAMLAYLSGEKLPGIEALN